MRWTRLPPANLETLARALLPRVEPGRFFAPGERRTFAALAEVLLEGAPVQLPPEAVVANVEGFLLRGRSRRAWRIRVLLHLIERLPQVRPGRPFSTLVFDERKALIEERFLPGRGLWGLCAKARHLVYLGAYGDERAALALGFVPVAARERYRPRPGGEREPLESRG